MADNHTPLPWKSVPWHVEEGPSAVRDPSGNLICEVPSDADANMIARAVNSHDALVKALHWIANSPAAHPANMVSVARDALALVVTSGNRKSEA